MTNILIVDDNPIQAVTRRMILERSHLQASISPTGRHALERIDAGESFSMVISDHFMPEMSGPELVKNLRERFRDLPIVVLSGLPEAEAEYEDMNVMFRTKPIPPEELVSTVRTVLFPPLTQTA